MDFAGLSKSRARLVGGAVMLALGSSVGMAQTATTTDSTGELETAVVSSTRLQNAGFDAPTPTQVLSADDLAKVASPNIFDTVIQLPALQGSTGTTYETGSTSTGLQGISSFALRGFSPLRTLTLLDGERVVGANYNGTVDVDLLPQMLVQRVDVVTGGASASWGSDAVAGVVNFVTDKKFDGIKVDVSRGISSYNDDGTTTVKAAAGTGFADNRGHIEVAGEYMNSAGLDGSGNTSGNYGCGALDGRNWDSCSGTLSRSPSATPKGQPNDIWAPYVQTTNETKGGIITSGPLAGTAFGVNGTPYPFNYAAGGVATGSTVTSPQGLCFSSACVAGFNSQNITGDLSNQGQAATLVSPLQRTVAFARLSYDITPRSEVFATFSYGSSVTQTEPTTTLGRPGNITIQCSNPYVPASIAAACTSNGITSFSLGEDISFPVYQNVNIERDQRRFVLGGDGAFDLFTKTFTWDTYAEYGETESNLHITGMPEINNFLAAVNAVTLPNGQIGCASAAARAAGCLPYNILGANLNNSPGSLAYVEPANGPFDWIFQRQEAFGATLNFKPVTLWAGDVATAVGVDYRLENYHSLADPYGNGVTPQDPNGGNYPFDPVNSLAGNNWYAGNYHEGHGQYDVKEIFGEIGVPIYKIPGWGSLDADFAGRREDYSQAGDATTWKIGLVWETPLSGVRLRALKSADLRAPNLSEAFAPNNVLNGGATNPFLPGNPTVEFLQINAGNPNLKPETSNTEELGIVFQPEYIRGLSASVDYYHIAVDGIIASLSTQQVVTGCYEGVAAQCAAIQTVGGVPLASGGTIYSVESEDFNLASAVTTGLDIEASYQFKLDEFEVPGNFVVRGLATRVYRFDENPGVPGQPVTNYAGALGNYSTSTQYTGTTGTIPTWKTIFSESYNNGSFDFTLFQRWFNAGTFSNLDVVCTAPNCPTGTSENPTINYNHMPGAIYWDASLSWKFMDHASVYGKVNNIANLSPPPSGGGVNNQLYDVLGRYFIAGVRVNF